MSTVSDKKFYPVIHCISPFEPQGIGHALKNTRIAIENGADGVFLIGHGINFSELCEIYQNVRKSFPEIWIGINFLDISAKKDWSTFPVVVKSCPGLNALWVDGMPDRRLNLPPSIQVFGGVAFKYLEPNLTGSSLIQACIDAIKFVDVATTSGEKTGSAPDIHKLQEIKGNLADVIPLALASGTDSNNVSDFLPYVDIFLVASSICERRPEYNNQEYFIPGKVRILADEIHNW